jgi:hypothetical protein
MGECADALLRERGARVRIWRFKASLSDFLHVGGVLYHHEKIMALTTLIFVKIFFIIFTCFLKFLSYLIVF